MLSMPTANDNSTPDMNDPNWRKLTFSQRGGHAPLPEALQPGVLNADFRNLAWIQIDSLLQRGIQNEGYGSYTFRPNIEGTFLNELLFEYWVYVSKNPHDQFPDNLKQVNGLLRAILIDGEHHKTLTFLECLLRMPSIPAELSGNINGCFEFAPYTVDRSAEPVCIIPVSSAENRDAVVRALDNINASDLTGAKAHLREAAAALNSSDFAGCIRASMHAVESAARQIDPAASKTLAPALTSLKKKGKIKHDALHDAFKKLYGYTSDEQGIRHALLDKESADVGLHEAMFMYTACVGFVDYLRAKKG